MEEIWTKRGEQSSVAVLFHQIVYRNTLYLGYANDQPDGVTQKKKMKWQGVLTCHHILLFKLKPDIW